MVLIRSGYTFVTVEVKVKRYNKTVNIRSLGILGDLGAVSRDDRIFVIKVIVNFHQEHFIVPTHTARLETLATQATPGSPRMRAWSLGKLVSFVFPQVLMIPLTSSREKSGLLGKQN